MITITYLITMGILCLIGWGTALFIFLAHRNWEREQANARLEISKYKVFC